MPILREDEHTTTDNLRLAVFSNDNAKIQNFGTLDHEKANSYLRAAIESNGRTVDKLQLGASADSLFQYKFLIDFQNQLNFIESIGRIDKKVTTGTLHPSAIDEDGKNLVNSMHTLHTDNHARFIEIVNVCKKIFPDIDDIHPKMHSSNYVSIVIKKKNVSSEIDLAYEGSGIENME